jgi:S1-C subfamily serine protease
MKALAALAALTLATSAAPPVEVPEEPGAIPSPYFIDLGLVERIRCGDFVGSGARIDSDLVLTAEHVVAGGACSIAGEPATLAYVDKGQDMAVLRTTHPVGGRMTLACAPYAEGREYFAIGYAFGSDFVVQRLTGTKTKMRGASRWRGDPILRGNIYQGMSGGPIVDANGAIVGIVNAGPKNGLGLGISLNLAGTYLCS